MTKDYMVTILTLLTILLPTVADKMFNMGIITPEGITSLVIFAVLYFLIKDILKAVITQIEYIRR